MDYSEGGAATKTNITTTDIMSIVVCIGAAIANAIIMCIILRYKSLKTPTYIFVLHWAIMDTLHLVSSPGIYNFYKQVHEVYLSHRTETIYHVLFLVFETGVLSLVFLLTIKEKIKSFKDIYVQLLVGVWSVVATLCMATATGMVEGFTGHFYSGTFTMIIYFILFLGLWIGLLARLLRHRCTDEDCTLRLALTGTYAWYWLLFIIFVVLALAVGGCLADMTMVVFIFAESNSIANLFILVRLGNKFRFHFYKMFGTTAETEAD